MFKGYLGKYCQEWCEYATRTDPFIAVFLDLRKINGFGFLSLELSADWNIYIESRQIVGNCIPKNIVYLAILIKPKLRHHGIRLDPASV